MQITSRSSTNVKHTFVGMILTIERNNIINTLKFKEEYQNYNGEIAICESYPCARALELYIL